MIAPFVPSDSAEAEACSASAALSLFELNSLVRSMLRHTLADSYWIVAEISEMRVASNGHCYVEFVQKDETSGSLVAKARGNIWRSDYLLISARFRRATGQELAAGLKVRVEVKVSFHELYGYSLGVVGIDPTYTLGDLAQRRRAIIQQLQEDGVMELNKELQLPRIIRRVAVVSSATAAGYGDFCNQLEQSPYRFEYRLFPALMQGDRVEESIIAALDAIAADEAAWDVVVIIRGGGATTDLHGFDSYLLASNVAQFPLPVLTGIGHERDDTIIDLVANLRLKTPTAVAAFLIDSRSHEAALLSQLCVRLTDAVATRLQAEHHRLDLTDHRLRLSAAALLHQQTQRFRQLQHRYELQAARYLTGQRNALWQQSSRLEASALRRLADERRRLQTLQLRLTPAVTRSLTLARNQLTLLERSVRLAGPERILALGFSITLKDGKPVRSVSELSPGDVLETRLAQGTVSSTVNETFLKQASHEEEYDL